MKKIILPGIAVLTAPIVLADYGSMMGYGMMGGYGPLSAIYGIVWFALAAFVFSAIFWYMRKIIVKEKNQTKR